MILRPGENGNHHLVGHCFVYDLQDSQSILGPLPSPWRVQIFDHFDQEFRWYPKFFNPESKVLTSEDPRLEPLTEWERIPLEDLGRDLTSEDPLICDFFRNKKDGRIVNSDPRLMPEALEARGVKLETFTLV